MLMRLSAQTHCKLLICMMFEGDTLWQSGYFGYHIIPYPQTWVFFIDDVPLAFWAHPCRYVFVDAYEGQIFVKNDNWPPAKFFESDFFDFWEWILETGENNPAIPDTKIYPNPFNDAIYISINDRKEETMDMVLYNTEGKSILETQNYDRQVLKTSKLPDGIYFISVLRNGKFVLQRKLIKYSK